MKLTNDQFIIKANIIHKNLYDYSKVNYVNNYSKIEIICLKHSSFLQSPECHLRGQGCIKCFRESKCKKILITKEDYIKEFNLINDCNYTYIFPEKIKSRQEKINVICQVHGTYSSKISNLLRGNKCKKCNVQSQRKTKESFLLDANKIHKNKFKYDLTNFFDRESIITIICPIHGPFKKEACYHLLNDCFKCSAEKRKVKLEDFIKKSNKIHNNKYDYSKVNYQGNSIKVEIICSIHGSFFPTPGNHTHNKQPTGCPSCAKGVVKSRIETEWLNYFNINEKNRNIFIKLKNGKRYNVDGYDPVTNTVYEFYGDFWHGNPKVFDQNKINKRIGVKFSLLYQDTIDKQNDIINNEYHVCFIWKKDYKTKGISGTKWLT